MTRLNCDCRDGDCHEGRDAARQLPRREFLKLTGGAAAIALGPRRMPVMAGPFDNEYLRVIPSDKRLDAAWVRSLYERGEPEVYRGWEELRHIGMPVGGFFAGTLYLGGDGQLWYWDIFNRVVEGIQPRRVEYHVHSGNPHDEGRGNVVRPRDGANFVEPAAAASPIDQGFALRIGERERTLDRHGFADVRFRGEYPIGKVTYGDGECPLRVELEAFSPFIPLNVKDSALPATIVRYTLTNIGDRPVETTIYGWMQNAVCHESRPASLGSHRNRVMRGGHITAVVYSAEPVKQPENDAGQPGSPISQGAPSQIPLSRHRDFGTMTLSLLHAGDGVRVSTGQRQPLHSADAATDTVRSLEESPIGSVGRTVRLQPAESQTVTFAITWHFPNLSVRDMNDVGNWYASHFENAAEVASYIAGERDRLIDSTRRWRDTWYDSTLPYWFLDRTMINTSALATTTCYRFHDGRFWAWEGVGCCPGTCTHVWQYAQAVGRLFPEIERDHRERVDFGQALHPDGGIGHRAGPDSVNETVAHDGQCGRILGVLREHQMSVDDAFLKRLWPKVKRAMEYVIQQDGNADGMVEGAQPNTLDAAWYGKIPFLASLYLAALRACAAMADEVGDDAFAARCQAIFERGQKTILETWNGEYFIQIEDPERTDAIAVGNGCHVDQIFGQSWAYQVGLPALFDREKQLSALRALWKYNFVPDVGPFREAFWRGRWYALAGNAGLLMCTWPKGGRREDWEKHWQYGYFNECWTGCEWQAAAHMIHEGDRHPDLLENGLAVARAIHDRYNARLRNPFNEIECSDHYSRAMASYGAFLAACGFHYHGPKGLLRMSPRLSPDDFKVAIVTAEGWGSYRQQRDRQSMTVDLALEYGALTLGELQVQPGRLQAGQVAVQLDGRPVPAKLELTGAAASIRFDGLLHLKADQKLRVQLV